MLYTYSDDLAKAQQLAKELGIPEPTEKDIPHVFLTHAMLELKRQLDDVRAATGVPVRDGAV
jgi:hypothetical protein